jgi:YggT family protein
MNDSLAFAVSLFLWVLLGCVVVRAILSWVPNRPRNEFVRVIDLVTEPMLAPARRYIPSIGPFDVSSIVVIVLLQLMVTVVGRV